MHFVERFIQYITEQQLFKKGDHLLLAVSGGVDSVALCELCHQAGYGFSIAHVNFRLREEESEKDEQFVYRLGEHYGVQVYVNRVDTIAYAQEHQLSIQVAARQFRYNWFGELLEEQPGWLLTAHHADDNMETLLMNFFRGTGIRGLRGMLPVQGRIVRPLLAFRKEELKTFAGTNQLEWREDASNESDKYSRNYFRHTVIPLVRKVFPEAEKNVLANLSRFREVELLYNQAVATHRKNLVEYRGNELYIPVRKLKEAKPLGTILYEIIREYQFSAGQLPDVLHLLEGGQAKFVQSGTHRIIRNRNWLIIAPLQTVLASHIIVTEQDRSVVFEQGRLEWSESGRPSPVANDKLEARLDARRLRFPLILRKWKTGDYFYPLGMPGKKKLARFFIDQKLSPPEKEKVWVLESDHRICWVVGHRVDDRFKITDNTRIMITVKLSPNE